MAVYNKSKYTWLAGTALAGFLVLLSGILLSPINHYFLAALLVMGAVCVYLLQVFFVADRNWLDIRAVFSAVWMGTIGLAALRLAEYQKPWEAKTWVLVALAYFMLQIGASAGIMFGKKWSVKVRQRAGKLKLGRVSFRMNPNRLFAICVITTGIGFACFAANVAIKGFIPCFSDIYNAYTLFYTKFHVFAVAATTVSGLCYYCIKTQPLGIFKKIILFLCIFYLVFAFPIMVVSRGVFVVAAVSLSVTVFYLHRKKLIAFILCLAVILGVYVFTSGLRNYTDEQLDTFFEPAQIQLPNNDKQEQLPTNDAQEQIPTNDTQEQLPTNDGVTDTTPPTHTGELIETHPGSEGTEPSQGRTFSLSPKMAFLYSYITVSHDNFNEAVKHTQVYTWGGRQLSPFNVILRSSWIKELAAKGEFFQVNPYLNTINLIGDFYYDFGVPGVVVCMLLWAFIFGLIQSFCTEGGGIFALMTLGNTMTPVALCFFSTWLSVFSHWMMWGTVLLLCLASCIKIEPKTSLRG